MEDEQDTLRLSASQLETVERCDRLWWFQKRAGLPTPPAAAQTFGTVLHACIERYLQGDLPFEDGWDKADGVSLTNTERSTAIRLFNAGVDAGIIERRPDQKVEYLFLLPVMEGVEIIGFIDLLEPGVVYDHKTAKSARYLKTDRPETAAYLGDSTQMKTYAYVALREAEKAGANPAAIRVVHNQFVKDPDEERPVRQVSVPISRKEIEDHWAWIQGQAARILKLRQKEDWESIAAPNRPGACKEYGGCGFSSICGGVESVEDYIRRMESSEDKVTIDSMFDGQDNGRTYQHQNKDSEMTLFKSKVAAAPPSMPKAPELNPPVQRAAVAEPQTDVAPWAWNECAACKGTGVSSAGKPCRICDQYNAMNGRPTSADFNATYDTEAAKLLWDESEADALEPEPEAATVAPPIKEGDLDTGDDGEDDEPENPDEVEEPAPSKAEDDESGPTTPPAKPKKKPVLVEEPKKRGRRKQGMTLLINCAPVKGGPGDVMLLEDILRRCGAALAEQSDEPDYYAMNAFQRRDMLAQRAERIAEEIGTATVVVQHMSPDGQALLSALKPFATTIFEGTIA